MTEATVGSAARAVNDIWAPLLSITQEIHEQPPNLRGLPRGLYCKSGWVRSYMGWDEKRWRAWRKEGMRTDYPDTQDEHVLTDWVIDFLVELGEKKKPKGE